MVGNYNTNLENWYNNFNPDTNSELASFIRLENVQPKWKKDITQSYEGKTGKELYLIMKQNEMSLISTIEQWERRVELGKDPEWKTKGTEARTAMLKAMGITEDKDDATTQVIEAYLDEIPAKIEDWRAYVSYYDSVLSEGDALIEGKARYSEMLNKLNTDKDFLDWWEKVGKFISEAKDKVE